jgi:hypothetical protein
MFVEANYDRTSVPVAAHLITGSENFTVPIRKTVEGFEVLVDKRYGRERALSIQLYVAAEILRRT